MNDVFEQATALRGLIQKYPDATSREAIAEALVACGSALVDSGEPQLALALLDEARHPTSEMGQGWAVRLANVEVLGLLRSGKPEQAHAVLSSLKNQYGGAIPHDS